MNFINSKLKKSNNIQLNTTNSKSEANIIIKKSNDKIVENEGYRLFIANSKINIEANTSKAVMYAFQTIF